MKCELCHQNDAQTVLRRGDAEEEELYVCNACARADRVKRQKKSQRTRKVITEISLESGEPPPIFGAIMSAFKDMVDDFGEKVESEIESIHKEVTEKWNEFPLSRVPADYRIGRRLHLEGLHLLGELDATKRALHALKMDLVGVQADGICEAGHAYDLHYEGSVDVAKKVVQNLLHEEKNARVRLFEEMPRVMGDAICRALAILKNCRLLSQGEVFDLLSPLRLAAREKMLDGIAYNELVALADALDLSSLEDKLEQEERDHIDAERADTFNRRFEDVVLNERAEGKLL